MSNITVFDFDTNTVRIVERNGEPLFVAKDVATILGYKDTVDAVARHCKRAQDVGGGVSPPLQSQTKLIPESDVYRLILRSNLPAAEAFEVWLVETVLPSIRKHGAYVTPNATTAGVAAAAQSSGNLTVARDLISILYDALPSLSENAKLAIASNILSEVGVTIPAPTVQHSYQMSDIVKQYSNLSATVAGKHCKHLKTSAHGEETYTTSTNGGKLVPQFRWNAVGKAACEAVLNTKGYR